jgi:hypothetical protein
LVSPPNSAQVRVLQFGQVTLQVGQVLADALRHLQIIVNVAVGRLGPALGQVDERTVGGALVGVAPFPRVSTRLRMNSTLCSAFSMAPFGCRARARP